MFRVGIAQLEEGFADSRVAFEGGFERPATLASAGLEVRLATTKDQVRRAQELRYRVFFEEGGAVPDRAARLTRRDICRFDDVSEHLIVCDRRTRTADGEPLIVGAYRLLRQEVAEAHFGFYSAKEFQVDALIARHPEKRFLELGRSCVAEGYRGTRTVELLWRGIWAYALRQGVDVMFGCASLPGTDPRAHANALRFLREERAAEPVWAVDAVSDGGAKYITPEDVLTRSGHPLRALPPLIKGYWRLGARFSREAVVDAEFGTTDVLVVLPVEEIKMRYLARFAPDGASDAKAA